MKRTIETKFWHGDTVCAVMATETQCPNCGQCVPSNRFHWSDYSARVTAVTSHSHGGIGYRTDNGSVYGPEQNLFATREEAQAECDRRNGEIKK